MRRNFLIIALSLAGIGVLPALSATAAGREYKDLKKVVKSYALRGTLESVIPQLEKFGGLKIEVDWPALKAAGVEKTEKVQLRGTNEEFIDIVDLLLAQVEKKGKPLAWRRDKSGVLQLTTQANVLRRRFGAPTNSALPARPRLRRSSPAPSADLRFEQTRLEDVLETLRNAGRVNFFINWSSLKTVGVTRDTPITIRARNVSVARALDLVMLEINGGKDRFSSVYWVVDKGLVRIDTGAVLDTVMRTRVEDVTDLLRITPNFSARRVNVSSIGSRLADNGKNGAAEKEFKLWEEDDDTAKEPKRETSADLRAHQKNQLIESIRNSIGQEMWHPNGRGTITIYRGQLVITQSLLGWKLLEEGNR
ncbi:MAG: hypothetical protein JW849_08830 [Phycisphaerae bacterium]|nr:hypothetical protein [Phycisphaerae bacterium]